MTSEKAISIELTTSSKEALDANIQDAKERGQWVGKLDFLLSCIGYAVGLGNVWRFPYLCYRNGGGAFLIPYIITLCLAGLPLFYFELALGQFASLGPITIYTRLNKYFKGVGWAMVVVSTIVSVYYNVVIMWALFYMFASMAPEVPWAHCDPAWATEDCVELRRIETLDNEFQRVNQTLTRYNISCLSEIGSRNHSLHLSDLTDYTIPESLSSWTLGDMDLDKLPAVNETLFNSSIGTVMSKVFKNNVFKECKRKIRTPSDQYWDRYVLQIQYSGGIGDLGGIRWQLAVCLFLAWIIIFLCLVKGVRSSGKVVYFTATFPYIVLVILLVRGLTLDGHMLGIKFFITPDWEKLATAKVWGDAATQIFYSLGMAFGGLITFASYNNFKTNCHRDAILVAVINCGTSVFAGFVIFSVLGFMAYSTDQEVSEVVADGPGLAFIAYPEAIARMPLPTLWAILFFFMLLTLGLDSQFGMMETIISAIVDEFATHLRPYKTAVTGVSCFVGFLFGMPCVTYGGIYVFQLMDWYAAGVSLMIISLFNLSAVMYIYGFKRFSEDVAMMVGFKPNIYWLANWLVLTPLAMLLITIFNFVQASPASYGPYEFEPWSQSIGWCLSATSIICIPIFFIIQVIRARGVSWSAMRPGPEWGPALPENRTGRYGTDLAFSYANPGFADSKEKIDGFDNKFTNENSF